MEALRILLLEDSPLDAELIQAQLMDDGITCEFVRVETGTDFQNALENSVFNLILSDYSLPAFDGISALAIAQATCPDVPFIFVSATLGEELAIETLKRGATDYVLKQRLGRLAPSVKRALQEARERAKRQQAEAELRKLAIELEQRVQERTAELAQANTSLREEIAERQRMEESLRRSESILRSYFELPLIGIAITSPEKGWLEVNDKLCEILGYERQEFNQMTWVEVTYPEDLAADLDNFNQLLAGTSDGYSMDKRFIRKNGQVIHANILVRCVRRGDGALDYFVALVQDITERKQTEERLLLLESVAVNANDAIVITEAEPIDKPGPRIIYVNEAFTKMTGYSLEEVLGKTPRILQGPKSDRTTLNKIRQALKNWQPIVVELINYRKDRSSFWVENSITPVANKDGWHTHWIAVQRDITERKQAEDALRLSDEVLQQLPDSVFLTDVELNIQKWTGRAQELFGYTASEAIGQPVTFLLQSELKDRTTQRILQAIQENGAFYGELICYRKDGSEVPVEATAKTVYDSIGNPIGIVSINRDITERKRAEQERHQLIREQVARLEAEVQGLKSAFLAQASTVLASSLDYETTLASVAKLAVPYLADWCAIDILGENQAIRRVAVVHNEPSKIELGWELSRRYPIDLNASDGVAKVLRTGKPLIYNEMTDSDLIAIAHDEEHLRLLRDFKLKSSIIVPLVARDRTIGAITLITAESERQYNSTDLSLVEDLGLRAALAVDNARLYRETQAARQIAEQAAERNAVLQTLTAAFSEALTPTQVVEVVVNQGLAALKASAGFIALLHESDDRFANRQRHPTLEIVRAVGYAQEIIEQWNRFSITARLPVADAVRIQQPIVIESRLDWEAQYPHLAIEYTSSEHNAWVAIPLTVEGRTLGAMGLSFTQARTFNQDDRAFMFALAQQCAQALARARAYAAERQARDEAEAARQVAEAANRTKDEFLAVLSHELRTPLNAMLGWTQLLISRKFDETKMARALETIDRNTKSLATLIDDILDVSRIMTGKLHLTPRPCQLISVIEGAMEAVRPAAEAKTIQLQLNLDTSVGSVWGDANRLQQIVWNLLSNAIKFTPKGGQVTVKLEQRLDGLTQSSYAQIQVTDTGKGIAPDFLPHVFERFRQENNSSTRSYGGLGLGLAIVRYLVELHGGTVQASSSGEGLGATFTVQLPIWTALPESTAPSSNKMISSASDRSTLTDSSSSLAANGNPPPLLSGLQILIVDDEADARDLLATILEQSGARVTATASATEALNCLSRLPVDILVSDIAMPQVDGYTLIRQVRELETNRGGSIPAVALTAYAGESDRNLALQAGFQVHLPKPFDPDELISIVAKLTECKSKSLSF